VMSQDRRDEVSDPDALLDGEGLPGRDNEPNDPPDGNEPTQGRLPAPNPGVVYRNVPHDGYAGAGAVRSKNEKDYPAVDDYTKEALPPPADDEIEFLVKDPKSYTMGQTVRSQSKIVGNFRYRILVFPSGTQSANGNQVSAFVEADPEEHLDPRWIFQSVKYQITVVNWLDYRRSVTKSDSWTFSKEGIDRGWHDMVRTSDLTPELGWVNEEGSIYLRASCYVWQAGSITVGPDYNSKKELGFIGLKNHGATCYMNGLLQSLFHMGEFRNIVYSIIATQKRKRKSMSGLWTRK